MSHFSLMVISGKDDNIEDLMAPYQEEAEPEFNEFDDCEDEFMEEYKSVVFDGDYTKQNNPNLFGKKATVAFPKFEDFVEFYHGLDARDSDKNRFGYWCNPNTEWDWYEMGGRWSGQLIIKPKFYKAVKPISQYRGIPSRKFRFDKYEVDSAMGKWIDWKAMQKRKEENAGFFWEDMQKGEVPLIYKSDEQDKKMTKKEYIKRNKFFTTYAILMDGEWHATGDIGWFGTSLNDDKDWEKKYQEEFIDIIRPDDMVTIIDCHI